MARSAAEARIEAPAARPPAPDLTLDVGEEVRDATLVVARGLILKEHAPQGPAFPGGYDLRASPR